MTYLAGSWNAICDVCGFKFKANQMRKRWDGLMVCDKDFEHDHPQKYLRVKEDKQVPEWVRNRPQDTFQETCYIWGRSAYADLATADCAQADNDTFPYEFLYGLYIGSGAGNPLPLTSSEIEAIFSAWFVEQRG